MSLNYVIIVNDNGELKTITATDIDRFSAFSVAFNDVLEYVLDRLSDETIVKLNDEQVRGKEQDNA